METSLLKTKLTVPPIRPQLVSRPRLTERLEEGLKYDLILISAPAGFGKTTLLSEWSRQSQPNIQTAWVSLDEGDNDPVRFWDYFIAALQTLQSAVGENALTLLHTTQTFPSQIPPIESVLTVLINDLASIRGEFVVALDDYHLIESKEVHDGITYLLDHLPSQMHLVIATRADPSLPLARFRGKGMMLEIGADDLRFTLDETVNFFQEMKAPELSNDDVGALNARTEGWVVGLKMAALALQRHPDIAEFLASFTGSQRYVMDYLMEEVLQKQTVEIRDFLLKTSVLERLSGPLCDAVTELKDSQDILLNLERGHLFIVALDESRQWYRYEHLFADLLRHQCETAYGTEHVTYLHRQASQWYEDQCLPDDAIHHALAARDWKRAMRLIYARCEERRKRGEFFTLIGWLQVIPEELLRGHHRLYSQYASFLAASGQFDAAEEALSYLESAVPDDAVLQGEVAFSLAALARRRGDTKRMVDMAEKALSLLPPDNISMRARATWVIGAVHYNSGLFHEAEKWLTEAYEMAQQVGDYWVAGGALNALGAMTHERGELHRALEMFKKAIEVAGQTQIASAPQCKLCRVQYELNDLEAAVENARLSAEWYERGGHAEAPIVAYFFQAQILLARGDVTGAVAAIERMDQASRHPTVSRFYHWRHAVARVIFAIRQNDLESAANWGRKMSEYSDISHPEFEHVPARLLIAQGKKEEAAELLRDLYERLVQVGAYGLAIGVRVCQALAADTKETAFEFLAEALIKGEAAGYIRTFIDEGKLLAPLLRKAVSQGITLEYTKKLLTIIEAEEKQKRKMKKGEGAPSSYYALLSERELEVLRLIAAGLSNQQIADKLIISLSTTKNHVHNIIEKLNVQSRTQAVTPARDLELI